MFGTPPKVKTTELIQWLDKELSSHRWTTRHRLEEWSGLSSTRCTELLQAMQKIGLVAKAGSGSLARWCRPGDEADMILDIRKGIKRRHYEAKMARRKPTGMQVDGSEEKPFVHRLLPAGGYDPLVKCGPASVWELA